MAAPLLTVYAPPAGEAYLLARYLTTRTWRLPITVGRGLGLDSAADHELVVSPRASESIAWLGPNRLSRFRLTIPREPGLCVRELDVVSLLAR